MFQSVWAQYREKSVSHTTKRAALALLLLTAFTSTKHDSPLSSLPKSGTIAQNPVTAAISTVTEFTNSLEGTHHIANAIHITMTRHQLQTSDVYGNTSDDSYALIADNNTQLSINQPINTISHNTSSSQSINNHSTDSHSTAVDEPKPVNQPWDSLLLALNINGVDMGVVVTVLKINDDIFLLEQDLLNLRLNPSSYKTTLLDGKTYVRLSDLSGIQHHIDLSTQTLMLQVPAAIFNATKLDSEEKILFDSSTIPVGGFFNYDLNWQRVHHSDTAGGLFEIGAFSASGNGTNTAIWRRGGPLNGIVRLDTTWNVDMPNKMQSVRFGDAISRGNSWGRSVRFGGIQWGTNFATQPGFTTFPMPTVRGEAILPSTIDLYVNNARRLQNNIEAGPFDLTNVPVVTGQGELQLVVRDLLGRQQVITQSYYASQSLLRPGLHDFSVEVGAIRENYGIDSMRYGQLMMTATDRLGVNPQLTRELRAEWTNDHKTLGAGGVWLMPQIGSYYLGTLNFGAAVSNSADKTGQLVSVGTERQTRKISYSVQSQYAARDFTQISQLAGLTPRSTFTVGLGMPLGDNSLGFNYLNQSTWEGTKNHLLSLNLSRSLGRIGHLSLNAMRNFSSEPRDSLNLILSIPLDRNASISADMSRQGDMERKAMQIQSNPPDGHGVGYRLRATDNDEYLASGTLNTKIASIGVEAARMNNQDGYRIGASGGVAAAGGGAFLSRRIDESFAVIKVDDYPNVRVYRENQEITRTDQHGRALIPRLRGYQKNTISIAQEDLPIDAEVNTLKLRLTPALRSAVVADFPVKRTLSASFRLVDEEGNIPAPGTLVQLEADNREFPIGYDGRVFISDLKSNNRLFSEWSGRRCSLEISLNDTKEFIPDLGTLICKGLPQ